MQVRTSQGIGSNTLCKIRKEERDVKKNEIIRAAKIYNKVMELLKICQIMNEARRYEGDLLFVKCHGGSDMTNEMGDILPVCELSETYHYETLEDVAAKYTEICLKSWCTTDAIYVDY